MFWRKEVKKRSVDDILTPKVPVDEECDIESDHVEVGETEKEEVKKTDYKNETIKPFDCFGIEEGKTEKWLGKCVKFWFCCMSFLWFLFGALTFAPVIFISNKVNVIFKEKKKSLMFSTLVYGVIVVLAFILIFAR